VTKIAVLISGRGSNFKALAQGCQNGLIDASICAVISNKPDAAGLQWAKHHGIPTYIVEAQPGEARAQYDRRLQHTLDTVDAQWLALAGFMRILGPELVQANLGKLINIHPSLLPSYTGLNTHQRVIDANEQFHGATVHFVTEELDGGPIIAQQNLEVLRADTAQSLAKRVLEIEHRLYPFALQLCVSGNARYVNGECYLDDRAVNVSPLNTIASNGHKT
jgi:phosphoribosylglycinamide formyltransferase-1